MHIFEEAPPRWVDGASQGPDGDLLGGTRARSHYAYTSAVPDKPINLTEVLVNEARTRGFTTWRACCRRGGWIAATAQSRSGSCLRSNQPDYHPLRPSGLPSTSSNGLTKAQLPAALHTAECAESCATVRPIEMRGSQLIGLNLVMRHRGQMTRA